MKSSILSPLTLSLAADMIISIRIAEDGDDVTSNHTELLSFIQLQTDKKSLERPSSLLMESMSSPSGQSDEATK